MCSESLNYKLSGSQEHDIFVCRFFLLLDLLNGFFCWFLAQGLLLKGNKAACSVFLWFRVRNYVFWLFLLAQTVQNSSFRLLLPLRRLFREFLEVLLQADAVFFQSLLKIIESDLFVLLDQVEVDHTYFILVLRGSVLQLSLDDGSNFQHLRLLSGVPKGHLLTRIDLLLRRKLGFNSFASGSQEIVGLFVSNVLESLVNGVC